MSLRMLARETEKVFARHETFHPRYGWLRKSVEGVATDPSLFTREDATVALGVGKNMVRAIRYWGQAFKLLEEVRNPSQPRLAYLKPSEFGNALFNEEGWDPYVEAPGTLWLLHWKLLAPRSKAPAWWLIFNSFQSIQFTDATLHRFVFDAVSSVPGWTGIVESSVKKDVDCAIRMYAPKRSGQVVDDLIDCPFRELGIMEPVPGESKTFRFVIGPKLNLPDDILAYTILDFMTSNDSNIKTITLARLAQDCGSPGRVFKLTEADIYDSLMRFVCHNTRLHITEQAGVKQLLVDGDIKQIAYAVLTDYYRATTNSSKVIANLPHEALVVENTPERIKNEHEDLKASWEIEISSRLGESDSSFSDGDILDEPSKSLSHNITIRSHFQRSINLERDADSQVVDSYIPTARSVDVIRRLTAAMHDRSLPRTWSIIGPYGSGKSSFAQFLDALFGPEGFTRASAEAVLESIGTDLLNEVRRGRECLGAAGKGFIRAVVTAQREPVNLTLIRALKNGADRYWGKEVLPNEIERAFEEVERLQNTQQVTEALTTLSSYAPVLLIIDEFGKNIEAFSEGAAVADLFVLQNVAEKVSGIEGLPVFIFTLQHLALTDYSLPTALRREWSKVQGRFEEIPFLDSPEQAIRVLSRVFDRSSACRSFEREINGWAKRMYKVCKDLGLSHVFGDGPDLIADCYPLHPVTTLALPELCARYAQNARTLFTFIASHEPASVASFLGRAIISREIPTVNLDQVYEYFISCNSSMVGAAAEGARWLEIERRLSETHGLDPEDERYLRVIAVLNLVSTGGALRASRAMIEFALGDMRSKSKPVNAKLAELEAGGLITYRKFADEFRIWQGSDFDIPGAISASRERIQGKPMADLLETVIPLVPAIAGRHSQKKGILRYFTRHFVDEASRPFENPIEADGMIFYLISEDVPANVLMPDPNSKPIIIMRTPDTSLIKESAYEVVALRDVLENSEALASDWVARREVQERLALAQRRLEKVLEDAFRPSRPDLICTLAGSEERISVNGSLSRMLSDLCDTVYSSSPEIRNEMLARRDLTSQGAKARRDLIEAMINNSDEDRLGLSRYGPERAMYESILCWSGLHGRIQGDLFGFTEPYSEGGFKEVWVRLTDLLEEARIRHISVREIYSFLMAPPIGLKEGPIPVLLTAALLNWNDEIAVYEDGTYQPQLSTAHIERLIKAPERFTVKVFAFSGVREEVVKAIAERFGIKVRTRGRNRNSTILSVVVPLISKITSFPQYTLRTNNLSERTLSVRNALLNSREPDQLLFSDLPTACGLKEFLPNMSRPTSQIQEFANRLHGCFVELERAYPRLLENINEALKHKLGTPSDVSLRNDLKVRASHLIDKVLNPKLRSLLLVASNQSLDDSEWIEAIAMSISGCPPQTWKDEDDTNFQFALHDIAGTFARLEALYFERRTEAREGFEARRVIVTAPDGSEISRVVWVDKTMERVLTDVLEEAMKKVEAIFGNAGQVAFLAMLAKRLDDCKGVGIESQHLMEGGHSG
ncbi:MAG: DUF4007 family protein [Bacillota bacterium]